MMKVVGILVIAVLFSTSTPLVSRLAAEGALAIGKPAVVAKDGFASGISFGHTTIDAARAAALRDCQTMKNSGAAARALCTVYNTFRDQCAAVSEDPEAGTPGVGWAVAASLRLAENQALDRCRATAGQKRTRYCVVTMSGCDGSAK